MSSAAKYSYLAPKAFYEKGMLLKVEDYKSLIEARDLEDLLSKLEETSYKRFIGKIEGEITPEYIEGVALKALAETVKKIYRAVPEGKPKEFFEAFVEKLLVGEIKVLLRVLLEGHTGREAEARIDWELLKVLGADKLFKLLTSYEGLRDVINYLKNLPYREYLEDAETVYQTTKDPGIYEMFLDKYILEKLTKGLEELGGGDKVECLPLIVWDIDFYNINVIVRGKQRRMPIGVLTKLIIRYGSVGRGGLMSKLMASENPMAELATTKFGYEARKYGLHRLTLESLEILYRRKMFQLGYRKFLGAPFHLGLAVALAYLKEIEAKTIAGIAVAVKNELSREEIKDILPILF